MSPTSFIDPGLIADPWIFPVGSHQKLNSQSHVFVVKFLTKLVSKSLPFVSGLLVIFVAPDRRGTNGNLTI